MSAATCDMLHLAGFQILHQPTIRRKNSVDIALVTSAMQVLSDRPWIEEFAIISGDRDFLPLITTLRGYGKKVTVFSRAESTSEELFNIADDWYDISQFEYGEEEEFGDDRESELIEEDPRELRAAAFQTLQKAIELADQHGKKPGIGLVKILVKGINPDFDERSLGFHTWKEFIQAAQAEGYITTTGEGAAALIWNVEKKDKRLSPEADLGEAFRLLVQVFEDLVDASGRVLFSALKSEILKRQPKFNEKRFGFKKFHLFVQAAEKMRYVGITTEGLVWYVTRSSQTPGAPKLSDAGLSLVNIREKLDETFRFMEREEMRPYLEAVTSTLRKKHGVRLEMLGFQSPLDFFAALADRGLVEVVQADRLDIFPPDHRWEYWTPEDPKPALTEGELGELRSFVRGLPPETFKAHSKRYTFALFLKEEGPEKFREMPLGKLILIVQQAVSVHGILKFEGWNLQPNL
ncbi:MAG: NYN domain-containing protein [Promethearchaeota archaeon]